MLTAGDWKPKIWELEEVYQFGINFCYPTSAGKREYQQEGDSAFLKYKVI